MTLVYDRTQADVYEAGQIIARYKTGGWSLLSESEKEQLERGVYTVSVINRVEAACEELKNTLSIYGYYAGITTKQWARGQRFTESERIRYIGNIKALRAAFYTFRDAPGTPEHFMGHAEANAIERILADMYEIIPMIVDSFRYSGQFYTGGSADVVGIRFVRYDRLKDRLGRALYDNLGRELYAKR